MLAPAGLARPIQRKINAEIARVLELPDVRERLQNIGYVIAPGTPDEYHALLRTQIETLSRVTREIGFRPK